MVFASWIIQARSPASHNWPLSISPRKYQKAARYLYGESFNISIQKLLFIQDCLRNHCCLLEAQKKPDHTIAQGAKLPPQILKNISRKLEVGSATRRNKRPSLPKCFSHFLPSNGHEIDSGLHFFSMLGLAHKLMHSLEAIGPQAELMACILTCLTFQHLPLPALPFNPIPVPPSSKTM